MLLMREFIKFTGVNHLKVIKFSLEKVEEKKLDKMYNQCRMECILKCHL